MTRLPGPVGRSDQEWDLRVQIADRVRELLGPGPDSLLAKRLGDRSRTRAHKILNPDRDRDVGQLITLALVIELAQALDVSLVAFLAPMLGSDDVDAIERDANRRRTEELLAKMDKMVEQQRARLDRPAVERLLRQVAFCCSYMTDAEVEYEVEGWDRRLSWRWIKATKATGLPVHDVTPQPPEDAGDGPDAGPQTHPRDGSASRPGG